VRDTQSAWDARAGKHQSPCPTTGTHTAPGHKGGSFLRRAFGVSNGVPDGLMNPTGSLRPAPDVLPQQWRQVDGISRCGLSQAGGFLVAVALDGPAGDGFAGE
jgi:hypothetical protein